MASSHLVQTVMGLVLKWVRDLELLDYVYQLWMVSNFLMSFVQELPLVKPSLW